jgi:hypothetical protein
MSDAQTGPALFALRDEVAKMRGDIQALTSGLSLMLEVQQTHGTLLRELGDMLRGDPGEESPVAAAIRQLAAEVANQAQRIETLSGHVAGATLRGATGQV